MNFVLLTVSITVLVVAVAVQAIRFIQRCNFGRPRQSFFWRLFYSGFILAIVSFTWHPGRSPRELRFDLVLLVLLAALIHEALRRRASRAKGALADSVSIRRSTEQPGTDMKSRLEDAEDD